MDFIEGKRQKVKGKRVWHGLMVLPLMVGGWLGTQGQAIAEGTQQEYPPLQEWSFDGSQQILSLTTHAAAIPQYFLLKEPTRIVLDVPETSWAAGTVTQNYGGTISQIRIAQFTEGTTRFVLTWAGQNPPSNPLPLRSFPQSNGAVVWQLSLGQAIAPTANPPRNTTSPNFPPALLPPPLQTSVTIATPPNPQ